MTAREVLDGIKGRALIVKRCLQADPNDCYDMSDIDKAAEPIPVDVARLTRAVEAVLERADRLSKSKQCEDREIAEDLHAAIENALNPKEGQ